MDTVKDYVEQVLKEDEEARNNYNYLVIQVLKKMGLAIQVDWEVLITLPSIESITRACREIQNEENRLTPSKETRDKRIKVEQEYKENYKRNKLDFATMKNSHLAW